MRAAASGMSREDGLAAMDAEAKRLIAGKAPKAEGSIKRSSTDSRALIRWKVGGEERCAYGPRRSEERRAAEDLEVMREVASRHEDVLASRKAVDAVVRRLQQQAEYEVKVAAVGRQLSQAQQQQQQPSVGQRQGRQQQHQQPSVGLLQQQQQRQRMSVEQRHPVEDDSDSHSDSWEPEEADDGEVVYAWERFDDRGRPLQQQQDEGPLPPIPEPRSPEEASLFLAQFRPHKRTPEDLKLLLEARANPDIVIASEIWGSVPPLKNILIAKAKHVPIYSAHGPISPLGELCDSGPLCAPHMRSLYTHTR